MRFAGSAKSSNRGTKQVVLLFLIVLLASQACAAPFRWSPEVTPGATPQSNVLPKSLPTGAPPTTQGPQTTSQQQVVPQLAEVVPAPDSSIALNASLVFYFTAPMDAESVQRGMEITPAIAGEQEWLDEATLRFTPAQPLPPATDVHITFNNNVRDRQGTFLPDPVDLHFRTVDALRVLEQIPATGSAQVDPAAAVLASFNRPVAALGGDTGNTPPGFLLEPAAEGRGEWVNSSMYAFYPTPALRGGTKYTVQINPDLVVNSDGGWEFTTAELRSSFSVPDGAQNTALDVPLRLTFNQPMDAASIAENFALNGPEGVIAGSFNWNDDNTEMTFVPASRLVREGDYHITLAAGARSAVGTAPGGELQSRFVTISQLAYLGISPDNGAGEMLEVFENNYGLVTLRFNAPLDDSQDFTKLVTFTPAVLELTAFLSEDKTELSLSGFFQPGIFYILHLSGDIHDSWGDALGEMIGLGLRTAPARPIFNIPMLQAGTNILFVTTAERTLPALATNITALEVTAGGLSLENFLRLAEEPLQDVGVERQRAWQQTLTLPPDTSMPVDVDLTGFRETLEPGLYYYKIQSPQLDFDTNGPPTPFLVVCSNMQLTLKRGTDNIFIWAYSLVGKAPAAGLEVRVYDRSRKALANGITADDGSLTLDLPAGLDPYAPLYAVAGQPGDENFSLATTLWNQGVSGWEFGLPVSFEEQASKIYLYTDRPIYQPGQGVHYRVVMRDREGGQYLLPRDPEVTVQISGPGATPETSFQVEQSLALSDFGAASGELVLPEDAQPGYYSLAVQGFPAQIIGFQVANYRKPEIEVQAGFTAQEAAAGAEIQAIITAAYYFGAPAGRAAVNWTLSATPEGLFLPGGFQTGLLDTSWLTTRIDLADGMRVLNTGEGMTSADGTLAVDFLAEELREQLLPGVRYRLQIEATLQDESGNPVSARGNLLLHPAEYYIGLRPERYALRAGDTLGFDVRTVDTGGVPSGERRLRANFQKVVWEQTGTPDRFSGLPRYEPRYTLAGSTDFVTDANGRARLAFNPLEPGTYALQVSGGDAASSLLVWVGGEGTTPWPELPNQRLELTPEVMEYTAGQTARIFVPNPFEQSMALVTVERGDVLRWQVLPVEGAGASIQVPLEDGDVPNVYLSVLLMGVDSGGRPDFRMGYINLPVKPEKQILKVDVAAVPGDSEPGGEVEIAIQARDSSGQPAEAEFSLALVDKAALALADPNAPDIEVAFYGEQPLSVSTGLSLAAYSQRTAAILPGRGGGGGAGEPVDLRQQFEDTAYWEGAVKTDANGRADVRVTLPDNLTTWAVDVRGITQGGQVGAAGAEVITSKPLLIRPVTPRFLVAGDHVQLAALVHNNTDAKVNAEVRLEAAGMTLDDPLQAGQLVQVEPGARVQVTWWATAGDVGEVDLIFSARAGDLQDVTRPVYGKLPVLRYQASQVFATSGMLPDSGQRIERVSLPRTFTPTGGELRVEMSSSLAGGIISALPAGDVHLADFPEAAISRLLPALEAYRALQALGADTSSLKAEVQAIVADSISVLRETQHTDGGWGWSGFDASSDARISAYVLFGLARARESGVGAASSLEDAARRFVRAKAITPQADTTGSQLDLQVLQMFALQESGMEVSPRDFVPFATNLSPWGKALLALLLERTAAGDADARLLEAELRESAVRGATGTHWDSGAQGRANQASTVFTSAVIVYALAQLDPAAPLLVDAVRYLMSNRQLDGSWANSYETAWVLLALTEALRGTGDLNADFEFSANLNGDLLAGSSENALTTVNAHVPLGSLRPEEANELLFKRGEGTGRLYYRAFLQVFRPVESALAVEKGISITRSYHLDANSGAIESVEMNTPAPVLLVRLTLTLPQDATNVIVEDTIPAGTEILDLSIKTTREIETEIISIPAYDAANPSGDGWRWWLFGQPQITDQGIRWHASSLPAGVYQLTYRLVVNQPGEYRLIPARAYEYYFPETQGNSPGGILSVQP